RHDAVFETGVGWGYKRNDALQASDRQAAPNEVHESDAMRRPFQAQEVGCAEPFRGAAQFGQRFFHLRPYLVSNETGVQAVRAVRGRGAGVRTVNNFVDRLEGAGENLGKEGIALVALEGGDDQAR